MPTRPQPFDDPAAEASQFLIRLGLGVLAIAIPVGGLFFRRSVFLLFPVGAGVILLGALLAPRRDATGRLRDVAFSPMGLLSCVLIGWAAVSILWTPFRADAVERLFKVGGTLALAAAAAAVLPDRTRVANLYLAPVGVALAAALGLLVASLGAPAAPDAATLERALVAISLVMWPALAILVARRRVGLTVTLPILVATTAFTTGSTVAFLSMAAGGLAFAAALGSQQTATRWLGRFFAALVMLAPAAALLAPYLAKGASGEWARQLAALEAWRGLIVAEPLRLLTGHGLDAAGQGVARSLIPPGVPRTAIFDIWYELGVVGAVALAALLYGAFRFARRAPPEAGPALVGGLTHGLIVGAIGGGSAQIAWLTTIAVAAILFTAMTNGLYKTSRPVAPVQRGVRAPKPAAP